MARLEQLRLGARVRHAWGSPTMDGCTGTVTERTPGHYIDTSIPGSISVWVTWDNPHHKKSLSPQWCDIEFLEAIH
jgi:hypothetical protein